MEKILKVEIENRGYIRGTVGWLCVGADRLKIGKTEQGKQGAWLKDREGKTMATLAIRGWGDDSNKISLFGNSGHPEWNACDFICSNACWERMKEIQIEAVRIMDELWESEEGEANLRIERE